MNDIELVKQDDCKHVGGYDHSKRKTYLSDENKELLKEGKKAIKIIDNLKKQLIDNKEEMKKLDEIERANKLAEERNRKLALIHEGFSVDDAKEVVRKERDEGTIMAEKRVICGKPRSCKLIDGKVSEVFDDEIRKWMPKNEFEEKHGGMIVKKEVKVEKEEYKIVPKIEEKIEEKKEDKIEIPNVIISTTTSATTGSGGSLSGTGNIVADYKVPVKVNVDSSKVSSDRVKIENNEKKKNLNLIDEYVDLLYG